MSTSSGFYFILAPITCKTNHLIRRGTSRKRDKLIGGRFSRMVGVAYRSFEISVISMVFRKLKDSVYFNVISGIVVGLLVGSKTGFPSGNKSLNSECISSNFLEYIRIRVLRRAARLYAKSLHASVLYN